MICRLLSALTARDPDFVIGGSEQPYLLRWWLIPRNRVFNAYLHEFRRSDDDRALHDHPWWNCSILLKGSYYEHLPGGRVELRCAGDIVFRKAQAAHRIELIEGPNGTVRCWTLFLTGPTIRQWGFLCPQGWRHWKEFVSPKDKGAVGRGCE